MSMTNKRQRGFTLIELILFIVIVGVGVAGILSVFTTSIKSSADPLVRKQTIAIAETMLEEILLKEYTKPAGSTAVAYGASGWSRALFDTVDDYNGYLTTGGLKDLTDVQGGTSSSVDGLSNYNISSVAVSTTTLTGGGAANVKQVVVSVTGPQGTISLTGYRGNY
jgi:MSHA pilin protein MshD